MGKSDKYGRIKRVFAVLAGARFFDEEKFVKKPNLVL